MKERSETQSDVYRIFLKGTHVVKRFDRLWAILSADLVIEQLITKQDHDMKDIAIFAPTEVSID